MAANRPATQSRKANTANKVKKAAERGKPAKQGAGKPAKDDKKRPDAKPARSGRPRLALLEESLGHAFTNRDLLKQALTHSSAAAPGAADTSNERLEFLGDRVLGLLIAEKLTSVYPDAPEGELAIRLSDLVRQKTLADIANKIGLGEHLRMSAGESRAGGRTKPAILADATEAVIAALYLDGGLEAARDFVGTHWGRRLSTRSRLPRDAKTALQEWAQGRGRPLPSYRLVQRSGPDHVPAFEVEAAVEGLDPSLGHGGSKRAAEQAAALAMLVREGVWALDE